MDSPDPGRIAVDGYKRIGELFPLLAGRRGRAPVSELPTRARNVFRRVGIESWEQICDLDAAEIGGIRNVGEKTVSDILEWCRRHAESPVRADSESTPAGLSRIDSPFSGRIAVDGYKRIGELFPLLVGRRGRAPVSELPTRVRTAFRRAGIESWEQICDLDAAAIGGIRNVGEKTVSDILEWCRRHAESPVPVPGIPAPVRSALALLGRWVRYKGREAPTVGDLVELLGSDRAELPSDVAEAADELLSCSLDSWGAVEETEQFDALDAARDIVGDERRWDIWWERVPSRTDRSPSFRSPSFVLIGDRFGITGEAARQMNKRVANDLLAAIDNDPRLETIRWRAHDLVTRLGSGVPLDSPLALSVLADESEEQSIALWHAGPYHHRDGWLVRAKSNPGADVTHAIHGFPGPVIRRDDLLKIIDLAGVPTSALDSVVSATDMFRYIGDGLLVRWHGAIRDKAETVLSLLARPATAEEIAGHFFEERSALSIKNAMAEDNRFHRTSKTEWALREWKLEEYSGITNEIIERIDRDGGKTEIAALIEELVSLFGVSENSVRAFIKVPAFVIDGSVVRRRRADEEFELDLLSLSDSPRIFRPSPQRIVTYFVVNSELLRGTGLPMDLGLISQLHLRPGNKLIFSSTHQSITFTWPSTSLGASIGSLGPTAKTLGAQPGDLLVMEIDMQERRAECHLVNDSLEGLKRLKALTGIGEASDVEGALAVAIGVARAELRTALRNRGDGDLIHLLADGSSIVKSRSNCTMTTSTTTTRQGEDQP